MIKALMEQSLSRWWGASSKQQKSSEKISFVDKAALSISSLTVDTVRLQMILLMLSKILTQK